MLSGSLLAVEEAFSLPGGEHTKKTFAIGMTLSFALLGLMTLAQPAHAINNFYAPLTLGPNGNGVAYAKASGGASCKVTAFTGWTWDSAKGVWYMNLHFAGYDNIGWQVYADLEAPGWSDEAHRVVTTYFNGSQNGPVEERITYDIWQGTDLGTLNAIGSSGTWKFLLLVKGYDFGSLSCQDYQWFEVRNI